MAVTTNTILSTDVVTALDVEFLSNFERETYDFISRLGLAEPQVMAAGTALYQYQVTGALNNSATADSSSGTAYIEGDEVALSKYAVTKTPVGELTLVPYRKRTTADAILKGTYEQAVVRTDNAMLKDIRSAILANFFTFLGNGTGTATGTDFQDALAQTDATLDDEIETKGFGGADRILHFVNRFDIADYLGKTNVGLANLYGINYLASFLGVNDIIVTSKVAKGTIIATPAENIRMFAADFRELSQGGLAYSVSDHGIIGVHHEPAYNRVSCETHVLSALTMMPEYTDFIVTGTFGDTPSA